MFRRTFLKSIGTAILGTAIALKIPDSLVPKMIIEKSKMTFRAIIEAYQSCSFGAEEPTEIWVNRKTYSNIAEMIVNSGQPLYMTEANGIRFFNAQISSMRHLEDSEIHVYGVKFRNCGRFRF